MNRMAAVIRRHSVVSYFVIAYAISWAIWIPMAFGGARVTQGSAWPTHVPGLLGPLVAAFVVTAIIGGRGAVGNLIRGIARWRVAPVWYAVAVSPLLFFGVAAVAMALTGQGWPDMSQLGQFSGLPAVAAPVMLLLLIVAGYAEETGWRGFAVSQLMKDRSLLPAALIVGLLWAAWHLPTFFTIDNYRALGIGIFPGFALGIIAGSVFLAWLYRASGGSILIVSLWHGTFNLVSGTAAAHGLVAAVVTTGVMAWATLIVAFEIRRWMRSRAAAKNRPRTSLAT